MKTLADYPSEFQQYVQLKISAPELAAIATGLYRNPPDDQAPAALVDFALGVLYESWLLTRPERRQPKPIPSTAQLAAEAGRVYDENRPESSPAG